MEHEQCGSMHRSGFGFLLVSVSGEPAPLAGKEPDDCCFRCLAMARFQASSDFTSCSRLSLITPGGHHHGCAEHRPQKTVAQERGRGLPSPSAAAIANTNCTWA